MRRGRNLTIDSNNQQGKVSREDIINLLDPAIRKVFFDEIGYAEENDLQIDQGEFRRALIIARTGQIVASGIIGFNIVFL